jgi:hypothetical protein
MGDHMRRNDPMTIDGAKHILMARFPECEITAGYIGGLERWGDDRSWRIWCKVDSQVGPKQLEVAIGSASALPDTYGGWCSYIDRMTRLIDCEYLRDLANRLVDVLRQELVEDEFDQSDIDRLLEIANGRLHLPIS